MFPATTSGADSLVASQLVSFELGAFFIVPSADERYIGAQIFDPEPAPPAATTGRVVVRKTAADASGKPLLHLSLRGAVFQVLQNGAPVGSTFRTDASGRAVSGDLAINTPYTLHEVTPLTGANPAPDQPFTLTRPRQVLSVVDVFGQPPTNYNG